ncbi:MAG: class II aldolase/adducin family protein [Christensenellales bacterium]|jgi:L-fuculose-phosphate aldolase
MDKKIDLNLIREIIRVSKKMEEMGLVNTFEGNLSIMQDGLMYITPARTRKSLLTEDIIAVFDEDDNQVYGSKKASSEKIMHRTTYTIRDDIKAVIHCHSPYLTAHAMCHVPLDYKCHPEIVFHFRDIPVAPYGQPGTAAIVENGRALLEKRNLILLANHGVLAVGSTLEKAFQRVEAAEKFAMTVSFSKCIGPLVDIPSSEVERILKIPIET